MLIQKKHDSYNIISLASSRQLPALFLICLCLLLYKNLPNLDSLKMVSKYISYKYKSIVWKRKQEKILYEIKFVLPISTSMFILEWWFDIKYRVHWKFYLKGLIVRIHVEMLKIPPNLPFLLFIPSFPYISLILFLPFHPAFL